MTRNGPATFRLPQARRVEIGNPDAYRQDSLLRRLATRVRERQETQRQLAAYLPMALRPHIRFGERQGEELCLLFESAAWLTRARYQQHVLLDALRQHPDYHSLQGLRLIVQPQRQSARRP